MLFAVFAFLLHPTVPVRVHSGVSPPNPNSPSPGGVGTNPPPPLACVERMVVHLYSICALSILWAPLHAYAVRFSPKKPKGALQYLKKSHRGVLLHFIPLFTVVQACLYPSRGCELHPDTQYDPQPGILPQSELQPKPRWYVVVCWDVCTHIALDLPTGGKPDVRTVGSGASPF